MAANNADLCRRTARVTSPNGDAVISVTLKGWRRRPNVSPSTLWFTKDLHCGRARAKDLTRPECGYRDPGALELLTTADCSAD